MLSPRNPCSSCNVASCPGSATPQAYRYCGSDPQYKRYRGEPCCLLTRHRTGADPEWCQVRFGDGAVSGLVPRAAVRRYDRRG